MNNISYDNIQNKNIKVYTKRKFVNSNFVNFISWIILSIFAIASVFTLFNIVTGEVQYSSTVELTGTILFSVGFLIAYIWMLCKPTKYNLKLIYKVVEEYNGKKITNMEFSGTVNILDFKTFRKFNCYSIGENELEIGKKYYIIISRFDGFPIRVEE